MDPTYPWGTLGAHVFEAKGARGACVGGGVTRSESRREQEFACYMWEGYTTHNGTQDLFMGEC